MIPLFSKDGLSILEPLAFTKTLYAFDFDGTLAKIVREPSQARMSSKTEALLSRLAERVPIAVVSGRSRDDLKKRVNVQGYLVGNHGLEQSDSTFPLIHKSCVQDCQEWIDQLRRLQTEQGIELENKSLSLAIHYRKSRAKKEARMKILDAISNLAPIPRVIQGKAVFNLIPSKAAHRGMAVLGLLSQSKANRALYVGDDQTDEEVFGMNDPRIISVRVGKKRSSEAKYFLERQSQINDLLEFLVHCHKSISVKNSKPIGDFTCA